MQIDVAEESPYFQIADAILGFLLEKPKAASDEALTRNEFPDEFRREVFDIIHKTWVDGSTVDFKTIAARIALGKPDKIARIQTLRIAAMYSTRPSQISLRDYVRELKQFARMRDVADLLASLKDYDTPSLDHLRDRLAEIESRYADNTWPKPLNGPDLARIGTKERTWIIDGLLPTLTVGVLSGDGGTGKSTLLQQLSSNVALGTSFLGKRTLKSRVLYVNAEDSPEEMSRRQRAICDHEGTSVEDYRDLYLLSWASQDAAIAASDSSPNSITPTAAFRRLVMHIEDIRPGLVVLDPLSDLYEGDELRRAPARQFIGLLRKVTHKFGCAVLLASHPSLQGMQSRTGSSGSTAWGNSVRVRLYLERVSKSLSHDPRERILRTTKANYGPDDDELRLCWTEGAFVIHDPSSFGTAEKEEFLGLLRALKENNIRVNASGGINYAPNVMIRQTTTKLAKQKLARLMMELLNEGAIENVEEGPKSKRRSYLREKNRA